MGAQVEEAVKAQLGVNGTKRLMAASYTIGTGEKALTISRTAPSIEQYFKGTAHAKLAKTLEEKVAFAKSDKAHYAKLDKLFGDGKARTFEGDKIDKGIGDMLRRGFTLDQAAQYKAVLIAEAKATAAAANQGPSTTTMVLDLTQMALDLTGIVDPTPISDGSNALISLGRGISDAFSGEWKSAGGNVANGLISAVGVVPYLGDLAKAGKIGAWAKTVSNAIEMMAKNPALSKKLEPMLREIRDLVNKLPQSMIDALPADAKKAIESMKGKLDELFGAGAKKVDDVFAELVAKYPELKFGKDVVAKNAGEVNTPYIEKGWQPPYTVGTKVAEFTVTKEMKFVRVHGPDNKARSWMMREEDVAGLSPAQIKEKFALPDTPSFISQVNVPSGTKVRVGEVAPQDGWGKGGATQFELLTRLPENAFVNTRTLR